MTARFAPARVGIVVFIVGLLSVAAAQRLRTVSAPAAPTTTPASYRGGLVAPPMPQPMFVLVDTSGAPFDFWSDTQGVVTLLFFGYTNCPDECARHVESITSALDHVPTAVRNQVRMVFVTTNPDRDGPDVLRAWLDRFD